MAVPVTTPEPEKPLDILTQQSTAQAGTRLQPAAPCWDKGSVCIDSIAS